MPTPATLTQGQPYLGGTVQYDSATGRKLNAGETTLASPKSIQQPPGPSASPIPVISATQATNQISNVIKPTLDTATTDIAAQNAKRQALSVSLASGAIKDQAGVDAFMKGSATDSTSTSLTPQDQAAQDIANTAEPGYKFVYQKDGTRVQIPTSSTAIQYGMFDTKPSTQQFTALDGSQPAEIIPNNDKTFIGKMSDGSYAKFDAVGNLVGPANQNAYNIAVNSDANQQQTAQKKALELQGRMDQIINGTYPLTQDQQAQIDSVKQTFQHLIDEQTKANLNYQGGIATTQGLLGLSEYSPAIAMGTLKGAVDSGITKIADINSKLISSIADLRQAFKDNNFKLLETSYKQYTEYANKKQAELDKITLAAATHEKDIRDYNLNKEQADETERYHKAREVLDDKTLTLDEKKSKLINTYNYANLAEDKRHNLATELDARQKNDLKAVELYGNDLSGDVPFKSTINRLAQIGGTTTHPINKATLSSLAGSVQRGDWINALTDAKIAVSNGLRASGDTKLQTVEDDIRFLDRLKGELAQYEKDKGTTGFWKGTQSEIMAKLGQLTTDQKYRDLATDMNNAFVRFRADITGAAFSESESKGYQALFPSGDKNFELNMAVIDGSRKYLQNTIDGVYERKMGEGYQNLRGLAELQPLNDSIRKMDDNTAYLNVIQMIDSDPRVHGNNSLLDSYQKWINETIKKDGVPPDGRDKLFWIKQQLGDISIGVASGTNTSHL